MIVKRQSKVNSSEEMIVENNAFTIAEGHIRSAVDALGEIAKDDELARDCIANLSVVLLDMKSSDDSDDSDDSIEEDKQEEVSEEEVTDEEAE